MSDDQLSSGQRVILDALRRLDDLDLGATEPATVFRPVTWAGTPPPGFDLAALATVDETDSPEPATSPTSAPPEPESLPAACPDAARIIESVGRGEQSAGSVFDQAYARAEACNPSLNAFITWSPERGAEEARVVDEVIAAGERPRPLAGVPIAHKDILATEGLRTTAGSRLLAGHLPSEDATVVARLSNAGTSLVGKTNTHEFATGTTGTVSHFGAVRNPWNLDHMTGGSSSGSAAALAAGMIAAATGTDTGGSIRIPSACCGVVGLKPTYGRVSRSGVVPFAWGLDHVGPMARRVRDLALLLTAMAGPDPFDRSAATEATVNFAATLDEGVEGLRFAVPTFQFLELASPAVADAVREAGRTFEELGARRVDVDMPEEIAHVGPAAIAVFLAEGGAVHRNTLAHHPEAYAEETRAFLQLSAHVGADTYLQAQRLRTLICDGMARVFQQVDLLLTPTLPTTAPRLDARTIDGVDGPLDVRAALTLFTRPFNLTGLPALSMPCGFDGELPMGLQLVGRAFDEATVLRAAQAYETATRWHDRRPPLFP